MDTVGQEATRLPRTINFVIFPSRTETLRYMAVKAFALKVPTAVAPRTAAVVITLGMTGPNRIYSILYLSGANLTLVGGSFITGKVTLIR